VKMSAIIHWHQKGKPMNAKIFVGIGITTAALAVSCAPANARTSSPKQQHTYETTPESIQSPTTEVPGTKAQLPTNTKNVSYAVSGGNLRVELKSCKSTNTSEIQCDFIFANTGELDFSFEWVGGHNDSRVSSFFRAFDSAGTRISINLTKKGNSDWSTGLGSNAFLAQFPTPLSLKFKLPDEDKVVTFIDLIGEKVVRFAQIPIDPQ
jgi:hypothetical protein